MKRVICWLFGHKWIDLAINMRKHANLVHLHAMAGCKCRCRRCDALWDDLTPSAFFGDRVVQLCNDWHAEPLPRAEVRCG